MLLIASSVLSFEIIRVAQSEFNGTMHCGDSFFGLLTTVLTGVAIISSSAQVGRIGRS
jgi:hypothetical protein